MSEEVGMAGRTLAEKVWDEHVVHSVSGEL